MPPVTKPKPTPPRRPGRPRADLPAGMQEALRRLTRSQLEAVTGVPASTLDRWRSDGMPMPDGRADLVAVIAWLRGRVDAMLRSASARNGGVDSLEALRRIRGAREQLRLDRELGLVIAREDVAGEWRRRVLAVRTKLLALPRTLAGRCANVPPEVIDGEASQIVFDLLTEFAAGGDLTPAPAQADEIPTSAAVTLQHAAAADGAKPQQ